MTSHRLLQCCAVVTLLISARCASAAASAYDGGWWHARTVSERTGFVAGYLDCAVFDVGRSSLRDVRWNLLEPKITRHYETHPAENGSPVAALLLALAAREPVRAGGAAGEAYPGKHGMFDGEYWRQSDAHHRLGFVAGLIECWKTEMKADRVAYSKPAEWYVTALSQWFGVSDSDPDEINPKRSSAKIADALQQLHD